MYFFYSYLVIIYLIFSYKTVASEKFSNIVFDCPTCQYAGCFSYSLKKFKIEFLAILQEKLFTSSKAFLTQYIINLIKYYCSALYPNFKKYIEGVHYYYYTLFHTTLQNRKYF